MYQLEDRILFDGAAVVDVAAAAQQQADDTHQQDNDTQQSQQQDTDKTQSQSTGSTQDASSHTTGTSTDASSDSLTDLLSGDHTVTELAAAALPEWNGGEGKTKVLVVADSIWNTDGLLADVKEGTIIVHFDPAKTTGAELLQMINEALDGKHADSIGLLTGASKDGQFSIIADGKTSLGSLGDEAQQQFWSGLGELLNQDGRIDLFTSKLAGSEAGRDLVDGLSGLSGHQINASTDLTGDVDAGGDWDLEYSSVDHRSDHTASELIADYFDTTALDTYDHLLSGAKEIAFINPTVLDRESIIAGLDPDVEVVFLPRENAFEFMTEYLKNCDDLDAIHIFTHGEDGQFILGWTDSVDSDFITAHRDDFAVWGDAMTQTGDILVYGCNIAADAAGESFVDLLGDATGHDVAASTDRVGYGGDWIMEYSSGQIETHGYVFNNYFYSLAQWTVKNNADDPVSSPGAINRSDLSLREAVYLSQDGDLIVFDTAENMAKSARANSQTTIYTIMLYDTLVIDKNITIDGSIQMPGTPTTYRQVVLDGTNTTEVVLSWGTTVTADTITRNGIRVDGDLGMVQIDSPGWTWSDYHIFDANDTYIADVVLNAAVKLLETFELKYDSQLTGTATLAAGTDFTGHDVVMTGDLGDGSLPLNTSWDVLCDMRLSGAMTLAGGSDRFFIVSTPYTGTGVGGGTILQGGTVVAANSRVIGTLHRADGSTQSINNTALTVAANEYVVLSADSYLANGSVLADGSLIKGMASTGKVTLGSGTNIGTGTTLLTATINSLPADFKIVRGFTLNAGVELAVNSILPAGTKMFQAGDHNYSVGTTESTYIYAGTYVYQADDNIHAGSKLMGDLDMQLRVITVDVKAENITGSVVSDTTNVTTDTTPPYSTGNPSNLPAGTTTEVLPPTSDTVVTTTTDDFSNTLTTTTVTTVQVTKTTVVTAATETEASTVTTTTSTTTTVQQTVTKNGLQGVTLKNMWVSNGRAQVRPGVVGSTAGDVLGEGMGGGIYATGQSLLEMEDVVLANNWADRDGGGIWSAGNLRYTGTNKPTLTPYINWFSGAISNRANGNGGGIYNSGVLYIAGVAGADPNSDSGGSSYTDVGVVGNIAFGDGGGIYSASGQIELNGVYIASNLSVGNGGGMYIDCKGSQPATVQLWAVEIESNTAHQNGGGLYFTRGNMTGTDASLQMIWCDVVDNNASGSGGGVYITDSTGNIVIQTVTGNFGVNVQSQISNNSASQNGGGIAIVNNKGTVTLDFIKMQNNSADAKGGAIYVENSQNVTLTDMEISFNQAGRSGSIVGKGGGIFYTNTNSTYLLSVSTSNISNNTVVCLDGAFGMGGGIFLDNGSLKIENSTLSLNGFFNQAGTAYALGGAIYMNAGTLTINFSTLAYNKGKGAAIYIAGSDTLLATLNVTNSIIYNSSTYVDDATNQVFVDAMVTSPNFYQIYLTSPNQAGTGKFINVNFSTSNNIYSHYYKDIAVWSQSVRSDGRTNNALALSTAAPSGGYGSGWLNSHKVISSSSAEAIAIENNLYLDTELAYHANFRTQALAIVSQLSWAYNVISAAGTKYDQRGNLRVDSRAWTWDSTKYIWVQGAKTRASVGAFEAIFYLQVDSKSDDSKLMMTYDTNAQYLDAAYGDSGLTLREATFWVDSRDGLLRLANHSYVRATAAVTEAEQSVYYSLTNSLLVAYNRFYTGIRLLENKTTGAWYFVAPGMAAPEGEDEADYTLITDVLAGFNDDGTYNPVNVVGSTTEPAAFGYIIDQYGQVVYLNGVPQRISTTGTVGYNKTVFAAGLDNTINLTYGQIYTSRTWNGYSARKDLVIGDMYGLSYRAQDASDRIIVDANKIGGVFAFGDNQRVVMNNLTLTNGYAIRNGYYFPDSDDATGEANCRNGGGIWNSGVLTLNNVRITGNTAEGHAASGDWVRAGYGGGLYNAGQGRVYLYDVTIDNNEVIGNANKDHVPGYNLSFGRYGAANGAGIWNSGYMMIERSNISGNRAYWKSTYEGMGGTLGGGIFNLVSAQLYIANSTITLNEVDASSYDKGGVAQGGGIFNLGTVYSYGNTIYGNSQVTKGKGAPPYILAGFYNEVGSKLYIANTIVAENIATYIDTVRYVNRRDMYVGNAAVVQQNNSYDARYNVIGGFNGEADGGYDWGAEMIPQVDSAGNPVYDQNLNQVMIPANIIGAQTMNAGTLDPGNVNYGLVNNLRLEQVMDYNGAKTMNYRVLGGSVVLNAGTFSVEYQVGLEALGFLSGKTDQRGVFRTTDGNGNSTVLTNMGAFETISVLVVGTGSDSLNFRRGFDFANNLPLWESPTLTLREALYLADDGSSIVFKSGWMVNGTKRSDGTVVTNELNSAGNLVITLQGALVVNRDVTIDGNFLPAGEAGKVVPNTVTLQMAANVSDRIFYIKNNEANRTETVAIYNMQLSGGRANGIGTAAASSGGAIFAMANLTLGNVTISNSQAGNGGMGGGIYLEGGVLTLNDVTVQNCTALYGGGVYVKGSNLGQVQLRANNVSLIGNTAKSINGLAGTGGGLYVESGNADLEYVTIGNNKSGAEGGGIYIKGSLYAKNSTIANNTAGGSGGGIYFSGSSNDYLNIEFVTVANNQSGWTIAGAAVTGTIWRGGGIYLVDGSFSSFSSVVAQNFRGAFNLSTGTHDDLSMSNTSSWYPNYIYYRTITNNLFGTVTDSNGVQFTRPVDGSSIDSHSNYFLNAKASDLDWRYFAGLVDGYSQLLDSSLGWNGGKQMTIYVNSGKNMDMYFFRDITVDDFDQTQLEYFADNSDSTANRRTAGAFEKQARTVYYVQGDLKGNNLTASSWISANGIFLLESDGVLDAADTSFVFVSGHDVIVDPTYGDRAINQLITKTITTSTGGVIYYTAYYGNGRDQENVTDYQAMTPEEAEAAHVKNIVTVTTGAGTLVGNWTLFQSTLRNSDADRSIIVVGNTDAGGGTGYFQIAEDVILGGRVRLETLGTLNLTTTNYTKMGILFNSLSTTVIYSSAKSTQTLLVNDYNGNQLDYSTLVLTDGGTGKASTKTYAGVEQLEVNDLVVGKTVTFRVNAVPNQNGGDLLIFSSVTGDGDASGKGLVWTAKSLILGDKFYGSEVTVSGVQLDANRGNQLLLQATTIELAGYATLGSGSTDIAYRNTLNQINVNGFGNLIMTNVAPAFNNAVIVVNADAELTFNFGSANIELNQSIYSKISLLYSNSRLEFRTTGTLTQMVFDPSALAKITGGTLALYGRITVDATFLAPFQSALEIGGNVTLATNINYGHDITLNGTIRLGNISGTTITIASSTGKVVLGGTLDAATGKYISGNQLFSGSGKSLEVSAATEAYIGGLSSFKNVTVAGTNGIFLGGSVTASGDIVLTGSAKVLDVYDTRNNLQAIKLSAGGVITANGFTSDVNVATGQLQFQASNRTGMLSNLGAFDLFGSVNFLQGNFSVDAINAGALVSRATLLTVNGAIVINRNYSTTGELTISSGTMTASSIEVTGGTFTNSGTVTVDSVTIASYLNYDDPLNQIRWAGSLNNRGTMTVAGLITMNDGWVIETDPLGTPTVIDRLASTLINSRTLTAGGVDLNDSGVLENNGGVFTITDDLEVGFGSITNKAKLLIGGDLTGDQTDFSGGPTLNNSSTLTVTGAISLTGANSTLNNTGGTLIAHSIEIDGNIVNRAVLKTTDIVISTGSLENRGTMKEADNSTSQNPLWINSILLKNNASITNYATLTVTSITSYRDVVGVVYTDSVGTVTNASGTLTVMDMTLYAQLTNNGTLLVGGTLTLNEGHTNASDLDVRLAVGSLVNAGTINGVQFKRIDNGVTIVDAYRSYGRIVITGDGTIDNNSGRSITASAIQLEDGSFYNLGSLRLLPTYTFTTDKATSIKTLTSFVGAGFDGSLVILGKGAVNNSGTMTVGSIDLNNLGQATGDIANNGSITVSATFVKWNSVDANRVNTYYQAMLTDGSVDLNGNFINNAGKSFRSTSLIVNGIFDSSTGLLLSGGGISNKGTLNVTAASSTVTNSGVQTSLYAGLDTNDKGIGIQVYAGVENLGGSLTAGSLWAKTGEINNQATMTLNALSVLNRNGSVSTCTVLADGSLTIGGDSSVPDVVFGGLINGKGKSIRAGSITINTIGVKQPDGTITGSLGNEGSITVTASGVVYVGERVNNVNGQFATTLGTGLISVGNGGEGVIENASTGTINAAGIYLNSAGDFTNNGTVTVRAVSVTIQKYNPLSGKAEPTVVVWGAGGSNGGVVLAGGNLINNRSLTAGSLRLSDIDGSGFDSANLTNTGTLRVASVVVRTGSTNNLVSDGRLILEGNGNLVNGKIDASVNRVTNGSINVTGLLVDDATVTGRISVGGRVDNLAGSITATGLEVAGGDFVNGSGYTNTSGNNVLTNGNLTINTVSGQTGSGQMYIAGMFDSKAGSVNLNAQAKTVGSGDAVIVGDLKNNGSMNIGGSLTVSGSMTNNIQRTINIRGTVFVVGGNLTNNGTITASSADTEVYWEVLNNGTMTFNSLAVHGTGMTNKGTLTMKGALTLDGLDTSLENANGKTIRAGDIWINGAITNAGTITSSGAVTAFGHIGNSGSFTISQGLIADSLEIDTGKSLSAKSINIIVGNLNNGGTLTANGDLSVVGAFNNAGTANISGNVSALSILNLTGKTINIRGTAIDVSGGISNMGTLSASAAEVTLGGDLDNYGVFSAKSIDANGDITNLKTVTLSGDLTAASFRNYASSSSLSVGSVSVLGVLDNYGQLNARGDVTAGGHINTYADAGAFSIGGNLSAESIEHEYGNLTVRGTSVTVTGYFHAKSSFTASAAQVTIGGGLENSSTFSVANLTVTGNLENTLKLQVSNTLTVVDGSGSIVNEATGTVTVGSIFNQNSNMLYNNGSVTSKTITYTGTTDYSDGSHYTGNLPKGTLQHLPNPVGDAYAMLESAGTSYNSLFDDEAGQTLDAFLAY